jgi:hypothetical protein
LSAISAAFTWVWVAWTWAIGGFELSPELHQRLLRLVTLGVEIDAALLQGLLGLTDLRVFGAALIDRHVQLPLH